MMQSPGNGRYETPPLNPIMRESDVTVTSLEGFALWRKP